jgi:L-2,4-diaminobutyric acid acetyltransferase
MSEHAATKLEVALRRPDRADAARIHRFVGDSTLETNSRYAYLLVATHFRDTSLVAERGGEFVGFIAGYRIPRRPDTLFVWQIGTAPSVRRTGLGRRMLTSLLGQVEQHGVCRLEATVAPGNAASRRLFESLARERACDCSTSPGFSAADFGDEAHDEEVLFRIGPWELTS